MSFVGKKYCKTHPYDIIENKILYKFQYWFIASDSTSYPLDEIYFTVVSSPDEGKNVRFVFCDIA